MNKKCAFFFGIFFVIVTMEGIKAANYCDESENCLNSKVLNTLTGNILNTSDPCENFWSYACGYWSPHPAENNVDTFTLLNNNYARKLQNLLQIERFPSDSPFWHKLRTYLAACEDEQKSPPKDTFANLYLRELPQILTQFENLNWLLMIAELRQLGLNDIFLHEAVDVSSFDATLQIVDISMPRIDQSFESKQEILSYLQDINENIEAEFASQVFSLELHLKTLQNKQMKTVSPGRLVTLAELISDLPIIDWQLYFVTLMGQKVPKQLLVRLNDIDYLRNMTDLLSRTSTATTKAYMLAKVSRYIDQVRPRLGEFSCLKHMLVTWPLGLDYIYDRYLYKTRHEDERILENILSNLKAQFAVNLRRVPLSSKQLNFMENKLQFMRLKIGNLPLVNTEYFENYYAEILIKASNFYQNHWKMLRFRTLKQHQPVLGGLQQARVPLATYVVNDDIMQPRDAPYYVHTRNLLIVPYVFLQLPFYHHLLHPMLQYSIVGWMLAHELQHAFDPDGILLNGQGVDSRVGDSIRNTAHYQAGLDCLTEQLPEPVNLAERLADVNGLQLAFQTYFERVAKSTFSMNSPYTSKQLFLLNMAQIFCGSLPKPIQHDRDDVRVVISVANLQEFSAAFQCSQGTREHPAQHCHMWI